ncbi:MAG TPA: adenosine kinase [Opitutae bacterium]|nr:adenosine kinase [Coraliomargarita sp.]HBO56833.1 adenosine kinase [Opitutae bacterium]|tara:strand:- start:534 stop:1514 length:981 start_codon:yes stop_codon:yes gene_type:complete
MDFSQKIIGVGSPIVDTVTQVDESFIEQINGAKGGMVYVETDTIENLLGKAPNEAIKSPGGSAGNTLFALARMGNQSAFIGKTGNCENGIFYRKSFQALGGDSTRFKIGSVPNGQCLSLVTPDGERTMRTHLGAAMTLLPEEISAVDFDGYQHAHIEGYLLFNEALMRSVLIAAKEAGCTISLDLASFEVVQASQAILPQILKDFVDIVFANEEEGHAFTEKGGDYSNMALDLAQYCQVAVVKVGAHGSYVASGSDVQRAEAVVAKQVIDTTGAGDLWAAGFLHGWAQKMELLECAKIGSILGAAVVEQHGSALPQAVWESILHKI